MRRIHLSIICFFLILVGQSQIPSFFYTRFGSDGDDIAYSVIQSIKGDFIVVGSTSSFGINQTGIYISRVDNLLAVKWQKGINTSGIEVAKSVVELPDSTIYVTGFSNEGGNTGYDILTAKFSKSGELIWKKKFGGSNWDFGKSIIASGDGNLVLCGSIFDNTSQNYDGLIMKIDTAGNLIWKKQFGGVLEDELNQIITTNDGGLVSVGTTKSFGDSLGDLWVLKLTSLGDTTWTLRNGGINSDVGNSIVQDKFGDFLIGGGTESYGSGKEDAYILKINQNKNIVWYRTYGFPTHDEEVFDIKNSTTSKGNMLVCYSTRENSVMKVDAKVILLDFLGYYIDGGRVGSYEDDEVFSISNCKDGGYVLMGYTKSFNAEQIDVYGIRFDSLVTGSGLFILGAEFEDQGIDEIKNRVEIFPVPFADMLTLKASDSKAKLEIFDSSGASLIKKEVNAFEEISIDFTSLGKGVFLVKITTDHSVQVKKVVRISNE